MEAYTDVTESVRAIARREDSVLWIGFSGGLDSTVLLHACIEEFGNSCCKAIHVDHGINPNSSNWAEHCRKLCDEWGITLHIEKIELKSGNVELQGRLARYQQFESRLGSQDLALTAHHADDDTESRLWQLLTGRAIVGISSRRVLGKGHVERPFLQLTKDQLRGYAENFALSWIEDPSNVDTTLDRNWIRHRILPAIKERFPDVKARLDELTPSILPHVPRGPFDLSCSCIDARHIRAWLLSYGVNPPSSIVEEVIRQSGAREDSSPMVPVSSHQSARRYRKSLYLVTDHLVFDQQEVITGRELNMSNGCLTWSRRKQGLTPIPTFLMSNRTHHGTSKLVIRHNGLSKSLTSLFQECGVAPWLRDGWPILVKNESIACIPGIAIGDEFRAWSESTPTYYPVWTPRME